MGKKRAFRVPRSSENPLRPKFAELPFHALRCIGMDAGP